MTTSIVASTKPINSTNSHVKWMKASHLWHPSKKLLNVSVPFFISISFYLFANALWCKIYVKF